MISQLLQAASPVGRKTTVVRLRRLLKINGEYASIMTNTLFSDIFVNLTEAKQIAKLALQAYPQATLHASRQRLCSKPFEFGILHSAVLS